MAHAVTGFITKTNVVYQICFRYPSLRAVALEQGFSLFPLTDEILVKLHLPHSNNLENLPPLPMGLTNFLVELSTLCPLIYFKTEYFGGEGVQLALAFEDGKIIFGPAKGATGPINQALQLIDVKAKRNHDEFDTIGLGQYRFTNDWLK